ncbi:retrovirus-related pol polyprotein from transposon TNT 1-94 [Tanacetum coccineum]
MDTTYSPLGNSMIQTLKYDGVLSNMSLVKGLKDEVVAVAPTPVSSELWHLSVESEQIMELSLLIKLCVNIMRRLASLRKTSVARSPQQNGVVERRNRTLIEAACTMLIYTKAPLFLWAEAFTTACYTQNRSTIRRRHDKTPYELLHDKLPGLSYLHVFGALCYQTNDNENLDLLFQTLFDKLLAPPPTVDLPAPEVIAPIAEVVAPEPAVSTGSPFSTTVDLDAPSASNSQTSPEIQSLVIPNDVEEENHDLDVAHMNNDPFFSIPFLENVSEASSSSDVIPTIVHTGAPNSEHVNKWTKDRPLENIIGELERPVST